MHENSNLFLFVIEINNMHRIRHILPIARTCIWRRCKQCGVSWRSYYAEPDPVSTPASRTSAVSSRFAETDSPKL